jgi:hypothetical protein
MKFFNRKTILLSIVTILGLFALVKFYKHVARHFVQNLVYQNFYGKEILEAFAASDVSLHEPIQCEKKISGNIWLISYADGEKWIMNQNGLVASSINKCIDTIKTYRKKDIEPEYIKQHEDIMSQKRGAGFWLWKPYLILKTLNEMPENDILLYLDTGIKIILPIDKLVDNLIHKDIAIYDQENTNKPYTKKKLFQMMDMDNEEAHNAYQLQAGYILLKNTPKSRDFISKWLYWAEKPEAIMDSDKSDEYPEFIDHRHDQSILSLLYLKQPEDINLMKYDDMKYFFTHRRYDFDTRSLVFSHEPLTKFETWLSKKAYKKYNNR